MGGSVLQIERWNANGTQLPTSVEQKHRFGEIVQYDQNEAEEAEYLTYGCYLCEKIVSAFLQVPLLQLRAPTRSGADVAFARQIAMYLAHTKFSLPFSEVGVYFGRDRTTVAHGCHTIEDRRDDALFDEFLITIEGILDAAMPGFHLEGRTIQATCGA